MRFIEFMPSDGNRRKHNRLVPFDEILQRVYAAVPLERLGDGPYEMFPETARTSRVPGHRGVTAAQARGA